MAVEASSDDGHVARNTLDRDFGEESRWSANGDGEWIAFTLSEPAPIEYVQLAVYADTIKYFDLQYSVDGLSWQDLATSLETLPVLPGVYQRFDVAPVTGLMIRYVGHGSSASMWNSLIEVDVSGYPVNLGGTVCTPQANIACSEGHVYWFDACGNREGEQDHCASDESCIVDTCVLDDPGDVTIDDLEIYLQVDFESSELGNYHHSEYRADFNDWDWYYDVHAGMPNGDGTYTVTIVEDDELAGNQCMHVVFPANEWGLASGSDDDNGGGIQGISYVEPTGLRELYMSYNLRFRRYFDPVLGGKLPAFNAGEQNYEGTGTGFVGTLMFNRWNRISFYIMYPGLGSSGHSETTAWADPYTSDEHFRFDYDSYQWYNVTIRYVLNTFTAGVSNPDGLLEGYINGNLYHQMADMVMVSDETVYFDLMLIKSFFGGSTVDWATTREEYIDFDDIYLFVYDSGADVPHGNELSPAGRTLVLPNWPKE